LKSLVPISDKAFLAEGWNGDQDIIPKSQVVGPDFESQKSTAWWISAWILKKKHLKYSKKKQRWFNTDNGNSWQKKEIIRHVPKRIHKAQAPPDPELIRPTNQGD
jgi:hypothetical protein